MRRFALSLALCLAVSAAPAGAVEPTMHAGELAHALDRLAVTGRVLYVAAHPDDENTRLLAYLARHRHVQVAYLSMTRGGGGQNLIGGEQGELLDVIRTEELLAARRLDGAEQRFTRMRDFGYSKRAEETFATWGHDEALADVVWVVRTFQPDVIITRFSEQPPNHGHHTASAILAREAFTAAADPKAFPEQLAAGVTTWQATRLLYNVPSWSGAPPPPADALAVDVGTYDPRLGLSIGELAARSRSQHRSQGFGVAAERGESIERLVPLAGPRPGKDLLDGVDLTWQRFGKPGAAFARAIDKARAALERDRPEKALPALAEAHAALAALPDDPRVRDARLGLARVMLAAAGVFVRATAARPTAVPGGTAEVTVEIVARSSAEVRLGRVSLPGATAQGAAAPSAALPRNKKQLVPVQVPIPAGAPVSVPYWLDLLAEPGRYPVRDPRLVGAPGTPPALVATVELTVAGRALRVETPVVHAWVDPVHGERERAFLIVPPATVTPLREAVMLPGGKRTPVLLRVRAHQDGLRGDVELPLPAGWTATPATQPVSFAKAGDEALVRFDVTPPGKTAAPVVAQPALRVGNGSFAFREDVVDHPHIPLSLVLQPVTLRLAPLELVVPKGLVGYVRGSGDSVAEDLAHVGVKVEVVDDETLRAGKLERFTAIVVGIRAFNTRDVVRAAHPRLMAYVKAGGTVVVQYNTNSRIGPLDGAIGPCPLELGRERVTDETATMTPVDPKHPILRGPNRLGAADYAGWVQERGIYFAKTWDACYAPLFEIADPGEAPLRGSTLVARHGKGRYVYTGLAFFRQLPAGVPGAYRLLVNLLAGP